MSNVPKNRENPFISALRSVFNKEARSGCRPGLFVRTAFKYVLASLPSWVIQNVIERTARNCLTNLRKTTKKEFRLRGETYKFDRPVMPLTVRVCLCRALCLFRGEKKAFTDDA